MISFDTLRRASKLGDQVRKDQYCAHITGLLYSTILNIEERTKVRRRKGKVYTNKSKHNTGEHIVTTSKVVKWNKERMHCEIIFLLLQQQDQYQILF